MAGERAIVAERALEVVSKQLDVAARHNTTLLITLDNSVAKETSLLRTLSVNTHNVEQLQVDEDSAINTLSRILMAKGVTVPLQHKYCANKLFSMQCMLWHPFYKDSNI